MQGLYVLPTTACFDIVFPPPGRGRPREPFREQVEMYKDRVTFVHLYGPEPHPTTPATNFDLGVVVNSYWSTVHQPESYEQRLAMVDRVKDQMHPEQVCILCVRVFAFVRWYRRPR